MKTKLVREDRRFKQTYKEMIYTLLFFIFNILLVFALAFIPGYNVDAHEIDLIFGFPAWYFYGVILATILLCILTYLMVKFLFKDMSLDAYEEIEEEE
ncbi:DUF997 family protein [Salinicoccus sp. HZC-1]|uniref:DUF997 family protein n=1 Tax=Salinicoccus sp. HZC-1 TaxID=3385497 RepID=UPI00398AE326